MLHRNTKLERMLLFVSISQISVQISACSIHRYPQLTVGNKFLIREGIYALMSPFGSDCF